jgi:predicted dehydrogenase
MSRRGPLPRWRPADAAMLRVGIIGAARVATYAMIVPARARADVVVAAVAARDPARAQAYAATHGIARVHDDYAALAADPDIDLVYVATPPVAHLAHARLAIAAGKPVLVEKPFTLDVAEAEALLAEAAAAGVPVFEAMHSRHHAIWPLVTALLPRLGRLRRLDAVFDVAVSTAADEFRWDAALGGGALMDLGIYPLAWVRAVAGEPLAVTRATMQRERGADARFAATLALPGGVVATVAADMTAPRRVQLTVTGDRGTLVIDNPLAPQLGHAVTLTTAAGTEAFHGDGPGTYDAQLAAVVATLRDGAAFPLPADDAVCSMRAIALVRAAAGT